MSTNDPIDALNARLMMARAETQAVLTLIEELGEELGHPTVKGVPLRQRFYDLIPDEMSRIISQIRAESPHLADKLERLMRPIAGSSNSQH